MLAYPKYEYKAKEERRDVVKPRTVGGSRFESANDTAVSHFALCSHAQSTAKFKMAVSPAAAALVLVILT